MTFLVYFPGIFGDFILDDYINIVSNPDAHLNALTLAEIRKVLGSGISSVLERPLAMLSFGLNIYFSGLEPLVFKLTNVVIHLVNVVLVYLLSTELVKARQQHSGQDAAALQMLPLFVTVCWALHPANVSTVLYVVQRMTELSALCMFMAMYYYCRIRHAPRATTREALISNGILGILCITGMLFKENAVLIPLLLLVIEYFLFDFKRRTSADALFLKIFIASFLILPSLVALGVLVLKPQLMVGDYSLRSFTMAERLMTEFRVIWQYLHWLLLPDTRSFIFHHDSFPLSRGLLSPPTTLLALCGILFLVAACFRLRRREPLAACGVAIFLAGHSLESSVINLEIMFEHRNYLPGFGIVLAAGQLLLITTRRHSSIHARAVLAVTFVIFLIHGTLTESLKWANSFEQMRQSVAFAPQSHRANYSLAQLYFESADKVADERESLLRARHYFKEAIRLDSRSLRGHIGYIFTQSRLGEPLDNAILDEMVSRLETTRLSRDNYMEISRLTDCWYSSECHFPQSDLIRMYNAIGHNRVSNPIMAQAILDDVGTALVTVFNRVDDGIALLYLARNLRPELTLIDLKLVQLELQKGNLAQAEELLREAQAQDTEYFADELEALAGLLAARSKSP